MPTVYTYQFNQNIISPNQGVTMTTIAGTVDTLQSLQALDAQNQLALFQANLNAVAAAIVAKQNADKTELSTQQQADNVAALNLIAGLQTQVTEALAKAESLGSAELAQVEAAIKATIESNPQLISAGAGAITLDSADYTLVSAVRALVTAPKVLAYENLRDANLEINGAKISTQDGLAHIFNASSSVVDGVKTVTFANSNFYNASASFEAVFTEHVQDPIVTGGLTITLPSKWLPKSHTNIQIGLKDLVAYVAPSALITPDLNADGVVGVPQ